MLGFTWALVSTSRKANRTAKTAADAARISAGAAAASAEHLERIDLPQFVIEKVERGVFPAPESVERARESGDAPDIFYGVYRVTLGNHGRTPARIVEYAINAAVVSSMGNAVEDVKAHPEPVSERIVDPRNEYTIELPMKASWFENEQPKIGKILYVAGWIVYRDFRSKRHARAFSFGFEYPGVIDGTLFNPSTMEKIAGPWFENETIDLPDDGDIPPLLRHYRAP